MLARGPLTVPFSPVPFFLTGSQGQPFCAFPFLPREAHDGCGGPLPDSVLPVAQTFSLRSTERDPSVTACVTPRFRRLGYPGACDFRVGFDSCNRGLLRVAARVSNLLKFLPPPCCPILRGLDPHVMVLALPCLPFWRAFAKLRALIEPVLLLNSHCPL